MVEREAPVNSLVEETKEKLTLNTSPDEVNGQGDGASAERTHARQRVLVTPSEGVHNNGYDNEDHNYILREYDEIFDPEGNSYVISDLIGKGAFSLVAECYSKKFQRYVAVKIVKNRHQYSDQALNEVKLVNLINKHDTENNSNNVVHMLDFFVFRHHVCIVFELLAANLYELSQQVKYKGLSLMMIKAISKQVLESLLDLGANGIIHGDIKPENILFESSQSAKVKLIDLGSACLDGHTLFKYVQSRHYRAPEVIMEHPYDKSIDAWSLGLVCVELYLGFPLFPGASEYDQMAKIAHVIGFPPQKMYEKSTLGSRLFELISDGEEGEPFELKLRDAKDYKALTGKDPKICTNCYSFKKLEDIRKIHESNKESDLKRFEQDDPWMSCFLDFIGGLLQIDPAKRWTPHQALEHPFVNPNVDYTSPFDASKFAEEAAGSSISKTRQKSSHLLYYLTMCTFNLDEGMDAESYRPRFIQMGNQFSMSGYNANLSVTGSTMHTHSAHSREEVEEVADSNSESSSETSSSSDFSQDERDEEEGNEASNFQGQNQRGHGHHGKNQKKRCSYDAQMARPLPGNQGKNRRNSGMSSQFHRGGQMGPMGMGGFGGHGGPTGGKHAKKRWSFNYGVHQYFNQQKQQHPQQMGSGGGGAGLNPFMMLMAQNQQQGTGNHGSTFPMANTAGMDPSGEMKSGVDPSGNPMAGGAGGFFGMAPWGVPNPAYVDPRAYEMMMTANYQNMMMSQTGGVPMMNQMVNPSMFTPGMNTGYLPMGQQGNWNQGARRRMSFDPQIARRSLDGSPKKMQGQRQKAKGGSSHGPNNGNTGNSSSTSSNVNRGSGNSG